jgi:hypothetical protein
MGKCSIHKISLGARSRYIKDLSEPRCGRGSACENLRHRWFGRFRWSFALMSLFPSSTVSPGQAPSPEGTRPAPGLEAQWKVKLNAYTVAPYLDITYDLAVVLSDDSPRVLPIVRMSGA